MPFVRNTVNCSMINVVLCITPAYEDMLEEISRNDYEVTHDIGKFKQVADIIIANRYADEIMDVKPKVYCRDIFSRD